MEYLPIVQNAAIWAGAVYLAERINKNVFHLANYIEPILSKILPANDLSNVLTQAVDIGVDATAAGFVLYYTNMAPYVGSILSKSYMGIGPELSAALVTSVITFAFIKLASDNQYAADLYLKVNLVMIGSFLAGLAMQLFL